MKMLLASSDLPVLQSIAERLVAAGIPIALCKDADIPACPEVWIQKDSDFSRARKLLVNGPVFSVAGQVPTGSPSPDSLQESSTGDGGVSVLN
jgi:hypothetical protein